MRRTVDAAPAASARAPALLHAALRGAFGVVSPSGKRARLQILIFHRVVPRRDPLFPEEVDREDFDAICGWLRRWLNVLPLDEAADRLAKGSLPPRAAAITFDDGYADNHEVAMPVLRAHGLTATFFVATSFLDGGRMWNDTVIEALRRSDRDTINFGPLRLPDLGEVRLSSTAQRRQAIDRLLLAVKFLPAAQRADRVERIAELAGASLPTDLMMSTRQVRALAEAGMQVGAHTASHPILSRLDERDACEEIAGGRERLQSIVGGPVTLFAYPNGLPSRDYTTRDVTLVRRLGFRAAFSTSQGAAGPAFGDLLQLPRFTPWSRTPVRYGVDLLRNLHVLPKVA